MAGGTGPSPPTGTRARRRRGSPRRMATAHRIPCSRWAMPTRRASSNRPVDVGQEVLILAMELLVERLDDVADRDDADQLVAGGDGHLGDPAIAHEAHDLFDVVIDAAGDRVARHHVADRHPG